MNSGPILNPAVSMSLVGRSIGRYHITEKLGEGGMGVVYRAQDTTLGRAVAIKVLRPELGRQPERMRRFSQEARAASALNHPNIITVHDAGEFEDGPFLVMELVDGEALRAVLRRGPLTLAKILDIGIQSATALTRAHESGITHRDLKPENLLVRPDGYVKILDFGLAKLKEQEGPAEGASAAATLDAGLTSEGSILGTAAYMSPEQATGHPVDGRSDIFSLAVVLFEGWQGRHPFLRENTLDTMHAITHDRLPALSYPAGSPEWGLARVLEKALEKGPEERYQTMKDLGIDLRRLRQESESGNLVSSAMAVPAPAPTRRLSTYAMGAIAVVLLALAAAGFWIWRERDRLGREKAMHQVETLADAGAMIEAYRLAQMLDERKPNDPAMARIWETIGPSRPILTDPPGADVYIRDYLKPDSEWLHLGKSPLQPGRLPFLFLSLRVTKPGYADVEWAMRPVFMPLVKLTSKESNPPNMVSVLGTGRPDQPTPLDDFWLDRYETTNAEFKKFVDAGGYRDRKFWKQPFLDGNRALDWEAAMARFQDSTGRPGPATWELGSYPEGAANLPVSGISWFEAAAYAEFVGKELPTVHHWRQAALYQSISSEIVLLSNFDGKGPAAAGKFKGASFFGSYDMAGNVKEWCWNASGDKRYLLGGAWSEPNYMFTESDARSPFERAETFGFRCARYPRPAPENVKAPLTRQFRDYSREKPVSEEQFRVYKSLYSYDRTPLEAKIDAADDSDPNWRMETITFNAAYGNERVIAYLFLPKKAAPPYQTVVHFPAGYALFLDRIDSVGLHMIRYFVQSGRALLYPIYKGTYQRRPKAPLNGPLAWRDQKIQWCKDLGRSIDYLESRPDIDRSKLAYHGVSLGAISALPCLGVEDRFRTAILQGGGLPNAQGPPEGDVFNFAPRIRIPVLMLNGKNDFDIPVDQMQRPLFRLLGSAPADKRHFVVEGGHVVPRKLVVKESLDWLDHYLGPVTGAP